MTDQAPQIDDRLLQALLADGSLERLATWTTDERLRAQLKLASVKLSDKRVRYIDAAVDVFFLVEEGCDEAACRTFVEKHHLGASEMATRIARRGAGSKITGPAKAIFRQIKADPAAFERRRNAIKLKRAM